MITYIGLLHDQLGIISSHIGAGAERTHENIDHNIYIYIYIYIYTYILILRKV